MITMRQDSTFGGLAIYKKGGKGKEVAARQLDHRCGEAFALQGRPIQQEEKTGRRRSEGKALKHLAVRCSPVALQCHTQKASCQSLMLMTACLQFLQMPEHSTPNP